MNLATLFRGLRRPRQSVAFHYAALFNPAEVRWYGRFSILVTGGILSPEQTQQLKSEGAKLIAYEWSSGLYPGDTVSAALVWQKTVTSHRRSWLLSPAPLGGGAAAAGRTALWYNFADSGLRNERARYLAGMVEKNGYDGLFFDTLGYESLPGSLKTEFRSKHPGLDYDSCQGLFLKEVRKYLTPGKLIFTNQGYRKPDSFLPSADLDLSESYFTFVRSDGLTGFRKWWSAEAPWESISVPMDRLVSPASRLYPNVSLVHANYAGGDNPAIERALKYSFAGAKLWNHDSYLIMPDRPETERDELYFTDLGKPTTVTYQEDRQNGIAWRVFDKGVVAINSGPSDAKISSLKLHLTDPPRGYVFT